jgi:Tol biopolymer transport system component
MVAMMGTALEGQRLQASFTFRIVEAVKRMKISPMPRMAGLPWGLSIAAGIIITVLSLSPHLSIFNPMSTSAGSPPPIEARVLKTGDVPVDILAGSRMLAISGKREDIAQAALFAPAKAAGEGQIVFARFLDGVWSIWVVDADGENKRKLTDGTDPSWSPDGSQIVFVNPRGYLYAMNASGTGIKHLTESGLSIDPAWSPDGKQIAFCSVSAVEGKDNWAIHVVNADGTNVRSLGEKPPPHQGGIDPAWSPDGSKIAYRYFIGNGNRPSLWVMDSDGQNREMVYWWGGDAGGPDWSPDGDKIVFASYKDSANNWKTNDIFVINADGKNLKRLTEPGPAMYSSPNWSPDGTKIAFNSDQDGDWHLYVMNADGSNVQRLNVPVGERDCSLDWTGFSYAVDSAGKFPATWGDIKFN